MDNKTLAAILADVLGNALEHNPRVQMLNAAAQATRDHIRGGLPTPKPGDVIRCLFSADRKAFPADPFICKDGVVYDVVDTGFSAIDTTNIPPEKLEELRGNMAQASAQYPNAAGSTLKIRNRATGEVMNTTFPAGPGLIFALVAADAVDEPQQMDLAPGTPFRFTELTVLGLQHGDITPGKVYHVNQRKPVCDCDDPNCPGKGQYAYSFIDDDGDTTDTMIPFGFLGTCELVKQ